MSSGSTPLPSSGYASPAPLSTSPPPPKPNNAAPKIKLANVFSNDGGFLERIQRLKMEEDEKKKQDETVQKKREFVDRFKNRGKKRPSPDDESSKDSAEIASKKTKVEPLSLNEYQQELRNYADKSLKDSGIGVRPLVK